MAKKSKFAFRFDEMLSLADRIEKAGGDLQQAADKALRDTHDYITGELSTGIARHVVTGETRDSLVRTPKVEWITPLKAQVNIGFDLEDGGWPSIFLMWGTPKMAPDVKLRKAAFGPAVRREVAKIQKAALEAVLQTLTRG
ncbi:MAG: hypothetical protein IJ418_01805 [Clostridia bacterium]|nr:hypothetical protein [Clostridia bacterium]